MFWLLDICEPICTSLAFVKLTDLVHFFATANFQLFCVEEFENSLNPVWADLFLFLKWNMKWMFPAPAADGGIIWWQRKSLRKSKAVGQATLFGCKQMCCVLCMRPRCAQREPVYGSDQLIAPPTQHQPSTAPAQYKPNMVAASLFFNQLFRDFKHFPPKNLVLGVEFLCIWPQLLISHQKNPWRAERG